MLNALIFSLAVTATPAAIEPFHDGCELNSLREPVAMIVERAWTEVQKDEKQSDIRHQEDLKRDREQGKKYTEEVEKEEKLSKNEEYIERVQRVAKDLTGIANTTLVKVSWGDPRLNTYDYEFKVIEGKDINAFSLPGGYIYVYEGLLDFVQSDDELAGVMGHEIAHASLRHVATMMKQQSKMSAYTIPLILASLLAGKPEISAATQLWEQAKRSGWSVDAEKAADYAGFQYVTQSKYNPVGALTFMERLAKQKGFYDRFDLGIFTTHPPSRARAEALTKHLTDAGIPIRRSQASIAYRVTVKEGDDKVEGFFDSRKIFTMGGPNAKVRAAVASEKLNAFFDTVPELYNVKAEGNKIVGNRVVVLEFNAEDAAVAGKTVEKLTADTLNSIKGSLYLLGFRVWDPLG